MKKCVGGRSRSALATVLVFFSFACLLVGCSRATSNTSVHGVSRGGDLATEDRVLPQAGEPGGVNSPVLKAIVGALDLAPRLWPGYRLDDKPLVVTGAGTTYFFNIPTALVFQQFRQPDVTPGRVYVGQRRVPVPYLRMQKQQPVVNDYLFVRPDNDAAPPPFRALAVALGRPFLLAVLSSSRREDQVTLQGTLLHEGFHIFEQDKVLGEEPDFVSSDVTGYRGRAVLMWLYQHDAAFRRLVERELCEARSLLVATTRHRPRPAVRELLRNVLNAMAAREERYKNESIERFWYWMEGVPTFLEQHVQASAFGADRLLSGYPSRCEEGQEPIEYLYALYTGPILCHTLEYLQPDGKWKRDAAFAAGGQEEFFRVLNAASR